MGRAAKRPAREGLWGAFGQQIPDLHLCENLDDDAAPLAEAAPGVTTKHLGFGQIEEIVGEPTRGGSRQRWLSL
jgi:hypothetical protein